MKRSTIALAMFAGLAACRQPTFQLPSAPSNAFRLAEDAFARRDYATAAGAYRRFIDGKPDPAYLPRAFYQMALAQYRQQRYGETLASLDELKERVPGRQWVQELALRGDADLALGQRSGAVAVWEEAWLVAQPSERARIRERLQSVRDKLTDSERTELDETVSVPAVREALGLMELPGVAPALPPIAVAAAAPDESAGSDQSAPTTVEPSEPSPVAATEPVTPAAPEAIPAPEVAVESEPVEPEPAAKVACLLPLTGVDHAYGKRTLAGLRLAFADSPRQLVVRDTGGEPTASAKLLQQLGDDPTVIAVIGPLRSSEAEVTAPLAEREQLPMLLLSQREGLAGHFVLQAAVTRSQQVDLLVTYAIDTLKLRQFAVVYPEDGYGSAFATAFKTAAISHGASIGGTRAYTPGAPDFADITAAIGRWHQAGVDALFIPDAATTATVIAAEARTAAPDIALLGTESWNDVAALSSKGASINGAVFTDAFFADSTRPSTRQFVERFERGAGRPPTVFEAQAFDAGKVIRQALSAGATSRDQVIAQLSGVGTFEGAGELRSGPDGFQRVLSLLRYRDGQVEELTPGGSTN